MATIFFLEHNSRVREKQHLEKVGYSFDAERNTFWSNQNRKYEDQSSQRSIAPISKFLTIRQEKSQKKIEDSEVQFPILALGGQIGTANTFLYDQPSVLIGYHDDKQMLCSLDRIESSGH